MKKVLAIVSGVVFSLMFLVTSSSDPDPPPTKTGFDPDPPPTVMPSGVQLAKNHSDDTYL